MITEIHSFEPYEGFIGEISANPMLADPHFEYDRSNLYDALKKANRKAYAVAEGNRVIGLFVWLIIPEEKYIELLIGLIKEESAICEMLSLIEDNYAGYQLDFVINPRNRLFVNFLKSKHARFEEEQQWMVWEKETATHHEHEIIELNRDYEAQYIEQHNKDTYWTAEKVLEAKDRFRVFVAVCDGKVVGYMDVTHCYEKNEPYDLWVEPAYQNKGYEQSLLRAAIERNKPNQMMVLVDIGNKNEIAMYASAGFVPADGTNSVYATYRL